MASDPLRHFLGMCLPQKIEAAPGVSVQPTRWISHRSGSVNTFRVIQMARIRLCSQGFSSGLYMGFYIGYKRAVHEVICVYIIIYTYVWVLCGYLYIQSYAYIIYIWDCMGYRPLTEMYPRVSIDGEKRGFPKLSFPLKWRF